MEYELVLTHHGVKGMKWGVRKAEKEYAKLDKAKVDYKKAKKAYNEAHNRASRRNLGTFSPIKKHRENSRKRWEDAADKADKMNAAEKTYKDQKKEVRENTTVGQKIGRMAKNGAKMAAGYLAVAGHYYIMDQTFNEGRGTEAAKAAIRVIGMTAITAVTAARGGTDIHWYDKQGRKIV